MVDMTTEKPQDNSGFDLTKLNLTPIIGFGVFILVGGFLISLLTGSLLPPQASAQAQNTDALFQVLLMLGAAIFLLVQGLLVYSVLRFRTRPNDTADGPPMHGNVTLEIVWTIIPAFIVLVLAILSFIVWNNNIAPQPNENMVNGEPVGLNAIGQRYAWSFEYETNETNIDGEPITITTNELHTYVGQNVALDMTTQDVIHSFWVPAMRVKQDLLPGRETSIRFTPVAVEGETYPVRYRLICTELCGGGHGQMYSWLVVHENEEAFLSDFYDPQTMALFEPPEDPVARAELVLQGYPCSNCHVLDDLGWVGITGPSLNGIADRAADRATSAGVGSAAEYLVHSLHLPNQYLVPGYDAGQMTYFGLSEEAPEGHQPYNVMPEDDLISIVSYLCTQTASGDPADSTCEVDLTDPDATTAYMQEVSSLYYYLYDYEPSAGE